MRVRWLTRITGNANATRNPTAGAGRRFPRISRIGSRMRSVTRARAFPTIRTMSLKNLYVVTRPEHRTKNHDCTNRIRKAKSRRMSNRLAAALGCSARAEKPPAQRISYTDAPPIFCTPLLRLEPRMVPRNCGLSASSTSSTSAGPSPRTRHIKHVVVYPYCASWRPSCPAQLSRCCGPGTCRCRCPRGPARPPR